MAVKRKRRVLNRARIPGGARTPEGERWLEDPIDPPKPITIYFDRTPGRKRGRRCLLLARLEGGRRHRVQLLHPRKGERKIREIPPNWRRPAPVDPFA